MYILEVSGHWSVVSVVTGGQWSLGQWSGTTPPVILGFLTFAGTGG